MVFYVVHLSQSPGTENLRCLGIQNKEKAVNDELK